jgi:hypothetical protein
MTPAVVPDAMTMFTAEAAMVGVGWGVGLAGMGVGVVRGVEVATGVDVNSMDVGVECSRPIWNVPVQAVMARKRTIAEIKMRDFIGAS